MNTKSKIVYHFLVALAKAKDHSLQKNAIVNSFLSEKGVIIPNEDIEFRDILGPLYEKFVQLGSARPVVQEIESNPDIVQ